MIRIFAFVGAVALLTAQGPAAAQAAQGAAPRAVAPAPQAAPQNPVPPAEALVIMIRSTLVGLAHANQTNNYSVLNGLGSANFRSSNPPIKLAQTFESFRTNRIDLSPVVYLAPQLNYKPAVQDGRLRLVGYFPSQPMQVNYDLTFEPEQGVWKLFGISVNLNPVQQQSRVVPAQGAQSPGR